MLQGPSLLNAEDKEFVEEMVRLCPNRAYLLEPEWIEKFSALLHLYVQYRARIQFRDLGSPGPNPVPQGAIRQWIEWVFCKCPGYIIGGRLPAEIMDYARELLTNPSLLLNNPDVLMAIYGQATTRSRVALSQVNNSTHRTIRQQDYDPFSGHLRIQLGGETREKIPEALKPFLTELGHHTYNLLRVSVQQVYTMNPTTKRKREEELKDWSLKKLVGSNKGSFLGSNCRAEAQIGGNRTNAVNFIHYNQTDRESLIHDLGLLETDYTRVPDMHAEIRLAEKQDDADEREPIDIDKLCCVFCAAQLHALGRSDEVRGATHGKLQWYTFTPYVMYFQQRRILMWGEDVERIFKKLPLSAKLHFLNLLAKSCSGSAHSVNRDLDAVIRDIEHLLRSG